MGGGRCALPPPIFQVPMKMEIMSGSSCCECLFFISCSSWQNASLFYRMGGHSVSLLRPKTTETPPPFSFPPPPISPTRALTNTKSLRCVRSFSFSKTMPNLLCTRCDLISCRTAKGMGGGEMGGGV